MGVYRSAEVCVNGHTTTSSVETAPEMLESFCSRCGAHTITKCPECGRKIRGCYYIEGVFGGMPYSPPKFCFHCGEAFPWHMAKVEAAQELADELDELTNADREKLKGAISDLSSDTPKTELAAHRYKSIAGKLGGGAKNALTVVVTEVATEAAKKLIFGG